MRGQAGGLVGNLVAVLTTLKGLPLSYNRDMQHDKAPLFSSLECVEDQLIILTGLLKGLKIRKDSVRAQSSDEALCATDLADYLVSRGVAFREAHEIVGRLFRWSFEKGRSLRTLSQEELSAFSKKLDKKEVIRRLDPAFCAAAKRSVAKN
jgi:argininosuccinate lyase